MIFREANAVLRQETDKSLTGRTLRSPYWWMAVSENTFNAFGKDRGPSHLKAFQLAGAVPVRSAADPVQRAREKMLAVPAEQKQTAEAKIAG